MLSPWLPLIVAFQSRTVSGDCALKSDAAHRTNQLIIECPATAVTSNIDSQVFTSLREAERVLDGLIERKRVAVVDARTNSQPDPRHFRIFIRNTHHIGIGFQWTGLTNAP